MSVFSGINVAMSGIFTSQRALDVANNNIINEAKEGYSREQVDIKAGDPMSIVGQGMLGTGSYVNDIKRVRDEYLDYKYWSENQKSGEWNTKNSALTQIQTDFNSTSGTGITTVMDSFYTALQDLTKNPSSASARTNVKEIANTFAKTLNDMSQRLSKEQSDIDSQVATKVDQVNSFASQIASYNKQIYSLELGGHEANELRDERTVLINKLSGIVDVTVTENSDTTGMKQLSISIGGQKLVDHDIASSLTVQKNQPNVDSNGNNINNSLPFVNSITWTKGGNSVDLKGGELKGLLDIRDGNGAGNNYRGISYYITRLNQFASNYAQKFNAQHEKGYVNSGSGSTPTPGGAFFTSDGHSESNITAANIQVSSNIMSDPNNIAASDNGSSNDSENFKNITALINQRNDSTFFNASGIPQGKPDDFMKSVLASLSVDANTASSTSKNQGNIVKLIDTNRLSNSSVDENEEVTNAIRYQYTFKAASKMLSVYDQICDTIINKLGNF